MFSFAGLALITRGQTTNTKIETIIVDLNNDNRQDTIFLSSPSATGLSFNRITLLITGIRQQSFTAKNEWTNVDSDFLARNKNIVDSKRIFLFKSNGHSVILLFGYLDGAGYRGDFSIINIGASSINMVYDKGDKDLDIEVPITITDLDNDGRTDFVFRNLFEYTERVDSLKANVGSYSPFLVYTIGKVCELNKPLTKQYNEKNYVFAGYEYNEQLQILYPDNGDKPRLFKKK
jgi:hypothetical protein